MADKKIYVDEEQLNTLITRLDNIENKMILIENCYPIGAIYLSTIEDNPSSILGFGTWTQIKDKFLLAAGSIYAGGDTGGEATHTLTVEEMPNHNHRLQVSSWSGDPGTNITYILQDHAVPMDSIGASYRDMHTIEATGGDQPHNNMPPYLAVYVWKRTA